MAAIVYFTHAYIVNLHSHHLFASVSFGIYLA